MLSTILKQSKINYYNHYFETNWNSIKNTWKGIKFILNIKNISADTRKSLTVDGTTISNPMAISNIFNNYLFSNKHFSDFLKNKIQYFLFCKSHRKKRNRECYILIRF